MKRAIVVKMLTILTLIAASICANAQHGGRRWHGGDIRHFETRDRHIWRGGHWSHARYGGRLGWWWIVGPSWYFYSRPIYPYPDPYRPPTVVVLPEASSPSTSSPPTVQNWYFCEASKEYYPYVSTCPTGWKTVPAIPPPKTQAAPN